MAPYDENTDGWKEWSKHVLYQLEEVKKKNEEMLVKINEQHDDILKFKIWAGMIGAGTAVAGELIMKFLIK